MDKLTIKQAAQALGISVQTVRRRIAKGELPATKETTAYGEMWFIPASTIQSATQTFEVVSLTRSVTPAEISQIISIAVAAQVEPLKEEIQQLRAELGNYLQHQQEIKKLESSTQKRGFFQSLFGSQRKEN